MVDKLKNTTETKRLTSFEDIFSSFEKWEEKTYFLKLFDTSLNTTSLVYICCSWWPDSMFLTFLIVWYRHIVKWLPLSITKIIHVNHNTSVSDELLEKVVFTNFFWLFDIKTTCFEKWRYTETVLRKKRWDFYSTCIQETPLWQNVYLCLWHNLNDRIENSFLHFDRGTHIAWIVNMQVTQKKTIFFWKNLYAYQCFRPLLTLSKKRITSLCNVFGIPYENDMHNTDTSHQRIKYRKKIENLSPNIQKSFYEERTYVYKTLETSISKEVVLQPIFYPAFWWIDWLYKTDLPSSKEEVRKLLSALGVFTNMSKSRLQEIMKWFKKKNGALYLSWWWFLSAYGHIYLAKQECYEKFRETHATTSVCIQENNTTYSIAWYDWFVDTKIEDWTILTFAGIWDRIWSVSYMRRAAKKHIPFFRRRALPILKRNNKIVAVLPIDLWPWQK